MAGEVRIAPLAGLSPQVAVVAGVVLALVVAAASTPLAGGLVMFAVALLVLWRGMRSGIEVATANGSIVVRHLVGASLVPAAAVTGLVWQRPRWGQRRLLIEVAGRRLRVPGLGSPNARRTGADAAWLARVNTLLDALAAAGVSSRLVAGARIVRRRG